MNPRAHPDVTVIIPAYNCENWVAEAIGSALLQTAPPLEIIVVDDGSTDGTPGILAGYAERIRCITQPNQGVAAARNAGLHAARGGVIAFLDADDAWHPRKLEMQLRVLAEHAGIGALGTGAFSWPAVSLPAIGENDDLPLTTVGRDELAVKNCMAASSVVVRREVARAVGDFDRRLQGAADHDYWLRAAEVADVARLDVPLTGYREVAGSMSRQAASMEADLRMVLKKLDERDAWKGDRVLRHKAYSYSRYSMAYMYGASGVETRALANLAKSLMLYPLPYQRMDVSMPLARPRMLGMLTLRMLGLMPPVGEGTERNGR